MKNQVRLEKYYLPGELKARIGEFVDYYNTERYHESLNNLTPEDVYTVDKRCSIGADASS